MRVADPVWLGQRFRAMGTHAHVTAFTADLTVLDRARARIDDLESRWSRFLPDSALNRLNRAAGSAVEVDEDTFAVIALAVDEWWRTAGRFDPTVADAVVRAGYDRSFEAIGEVVAEPGRPSPGCAGIGLDPDHRRVLLPKGVHLDLGGIGKGRAADLVADELLAADAQVAVVNLGGDLRIAGRLSENAGLRVGVEHPLDPDAHVATVVLNEGALATTSRTRRCWTAGEEARHHVIDPHTGGSAWSGLASVTVLAPTAAEAEVMAKAAFVAGPDGGADLLRATDLPGLLVDDDGAGARVAGFDRFEQ